MHVLRSGVLVYRTIGKNMEPVDYKEVEDRNTDEWKDGVHYLHKAKDNVVGKVSYGVNGPFWSLVDVRLKGMAIFLPPLDENFTTARVEYGTKSKTAVYGSIVNEASIEDIIARSSHEEIESKTSVGWEDNGFDSIRSNLRLVEEICLQEQDSNIRLLGSTAKLLRSHLTSFIHGITPKIPNVSFCVKAMIGASKEVDHEKSGIIRSALFDVLNTYKEMTSEYYTK